MFRSTDHPQGAYVRSSLLKLYVKMIGKTLRYFNRRCGSISFVLCTLFLLQEGTEVRVGGRGRVSLPLCKRNNVHKTHDMLPHHQLK
jgi:hypothetical protein